ncbi:MAG: FtsX-like permease family protein [Clostridia bacterium]
MLRLVFRKILNNKWMVACLIIGCTFAIAVASAIPMYTAGLYNSLLVTAFKTKQENDDEFPFRIILNASLYGEDSASANTILNKLNTGFIQYISEMPLDVYIKFSDISTHSYYVFNEKDFADKLDMYNRGIIVTSGRVVTTGNFVIGSIENLSDYVDVVGGEMFVKDNESGSVEAVVSQNAASTYRLSVGDYYYFCNRPVDIEYAVKIKIVGIIEIKDDASSFLNLKDKCFYIYNDEMTSLLESGSLIIQQANCYASFNYADIIVDDTEAIIMATDKLTALPVELDVSAPVSNNYMEVLAKYMNESVIMSRTFILLIIPIILIIGIYVVMISQLMMEREKTEISTLESRGASRSQIFRIYFDQGIIISVISYICGIALAVFICKLLGAANGFMEFVNRKAITFEISGTALVYGIICSVIYLLMILVPAYKASNYSIVEHKQSISDTSKKPFWQIMFLDILLIAVSAYFLYDYEGMMVYISKVESISKDFTLFIAVTMFVLGVGLLFIRLFPYIMKLIFLVGKKMWKPAAYAAFTHVSRGGNYKHFIMIFLILSISIGIFNANTGRTLNENLEENIRYEIGADATVIPATIVQNGFGGFDFVYYTGTRIISAAKLFVKSEHVENATGVFTTNIIMDKIPESTKIVGLEPSEFSSVAYLRSDLNDGIHINNYLNFLLQYPNGIILSKSVAEAYEVEQGEYFEFTYNVKDEFELMKNVLVLGIVEYWPGMTDDNFAILSRDYYFTLKAMSDKGKVWINKTDGSKDSEMLESITELLNEGDLIIGANYTDNTIISAKKNSTLNGMNGMLTLDFLISMIICCVGFIIFWLVSVRQRVLQFGIFRAMGMSKSELYRMILYEQALISIISVLAGIIIGGLASQLFVPLFERITTLETVYIPFKTYQEGIDYIRIYIITGSMLTIGITVLLRFISRLKIDQALKLGED